MVLTRALGAFRAPKELEADAAIAFRALASHVRPGEPVDDEAFAREWCELASAAAAYPTLRPLVADTVSETLFVEKTAKYALGFIGRCLELDPVPSPGLCAKALRLCGLSLDRVMDPPRWLDAAVQKLADSPRELVSWLTLAEPSSRHDFLGAVAMVLTPRTGERLFDALWEGAPELRADWADLASLMIDRSRTEGAKSRVEQRFKGLNLDPDDAWEELSFLLEEELEEGGLSRAGEALFSRLRDRVLPFKPEFLVLAVETAPDLRTAEERAWRYFEANTSVERRLEALLALVDADFHDLAVKLASRVADELGNDAGKLAEALVGAEHGGACPHLLLPFAEAFRRADGTSEGSSGAAVLRARKLAKKLVRGPRKQRRAAAPKKRAGRKKTGQSDLPF